MTLQKYTLLLSLTLTFCSSLFGAALPEPAAARAQQVGYLAMVRQHILNATPLANDPATICAEYVGHFPTLARKKMVVNGKASLTCVSQMGHRYVLAGNKNHNNLEVIDVETGQKTKRKSLHAHPITAVFYQPPFTAVTASTDSTLRVWDIRDGRNIRVLPMSPLHHTKLIAAIGENKLISTAEEGVNFWDLTSGMCIRQKFFASEVNCLLPLHEKCHVAFGLESGEIKILNQDEDENRHRPIRGSGHPVIALARLSPDTLVALDSNSDASVWHIRTRELVFNLNMPSARHLVTCGNEVVAVPGFIDHDGKNVWRIRKTGAAIIYELDDLGLPAELHIDAVSSAGNSFALVARETSDPLFATSADWAEKTKRNIIYTFRTPLSESSEEKLEPHVQRWLDEKMKKSSCAIS